MVTRGARAKRRVASIAVGSALALLAAGPTAARPEKQSEAIRYYRLGTVQFEQGKTLDAIESLKKAIHLDAKYDEAHYYLGYIYMQQSEPDRAVKELKKAIGINPYFTDAHNQLGIAYRDMAKYDRAMEEFQIALNDKAYRTPERIHLNIGYLYLKQEKYPEAIASFERAVSLNAQYARGMLGLATAYQASGKRDLAEKEFRRVIETAPDTPEAAQARQALDQKGGQAGS